MTKETFKKIRTLSGLGQIELGQRADVPRWRIQMFEAGLAELSETELSKMKKSLRHRFEEIKKEVRKHLGTDDGI